MSDRPFDSAVVAAVTTHVNDDHADHCLDIVRGLGNLPRATEACLDDIDGAAATFAAVIDGTVVRVRVPWTRRIADRAEIRAEVVAMHERAAAALAGAR
ncbi:MAG: hypothetical protein QOE45_510 [Frankiaceae bacterium]|jgi:hypothetical protein|nr:hypothetical protein [Frankiaceae bacterium]